MCVCFSGDKLFGGPQAGIIVGKKKYIDMMKKNQLTRALRIDKFTAAALELVLQEYLSEEQAVQHIPVLRMITEPLDEVARRARSLARTIRSTDLPGEGGCGILRISDRWRFTPDGADTKYGSSYPPKA